ncbi:ubiquitin-conjugating enzyme E2 20 isoform X3 [Hevea brasiliensis]|uniref:ubiquitin-conjugating enzyme E2 20 isoform X3 n=1 Tax=Hevea brasiliensis TaxID=3981 RepID=UPI000B780279|nr:ubiquitin-conjugating enzyme E2 20 isoform X3 [Hevea brasiliensis]
MDMRPNPTVDNSQQHQYQYQRHAIAAPSKQPAAPTKPVDISSVSQRLQKELMSLIMSGEDLGVSAFPEGECIFTWCGKIEGGKGTVYEGLSYKLSLHFPLDYPFKPPKVKFETNCFHPNVDQYGKICLDILQNLIQTVLSTAMLQNYGIIRKITRKWSTNSTMLDNYLGADLQNSYNR